MLYTLFSFAVVLGILITFHELGHYALARACGVPVLRFSVGFGKLLVKRTDRRGTEWAISAIPLGGYVKMDDAVFEAKPVAKRFAIVAAGPVFNLLLAVLLYTGLNLTGTEILDPNAGPPRPLVSAVVPGGPADAAGLRSGDLILNVDGAAVGDVMQAVGAVQAHPEQAITITVLRDHTPISLHVTPRRDTDKGRAIGRIDVELGGDVKTVVMRYGPLESVQRAVTHTWDGAWLSLRVMARIVIGKDSWRQLSGPVTIADYAGKTARIGLMAYVSFMAAISICIGVMNLLPIPMLDGGHLFFYLLEALRGRPLSARWMALGQQVGMGVLLCLMGLALFNDLSRYLS